MMGTCGKQSNFPHSLIEIEKEKKWGPTAPLKEHTPTDQKVYQASPFKVSTIPQLTTKPVTVYLTLGC